MSGLFHGGQMMFELCSQSLQPRKRVRQKVDDISRKKYRDSFILLILVCYNIFIILYDYVFNISYLISAELVVDKAMELRYVGGVYAGNIKPTPFLCLTLKMLQIQPQKDIVIEFIRNEDFKYVRALGAYYMRLTGTSLDCYKYLEPLLNDYRLFLIRSAYYFFNETKM